MLIDGIDPEIDEITASLERMAAESDLGISLALFLLKPAERKILWLCLLASSIFTVGNGR